LRIIRQFQFDTRPTVHIVATRRNQSRHHPYRWL
jgi:hypothetical protein